MGHEINTKHKDYKKLYFSFLEQMKKLNNLEKMFGETKKCNNLPQGHHFSNKWKKNRKSEKIQEKVFHMKLSRKR